MLHNPKAGDKVLVISLEMSHRLWPPLKHRAFLAIGEALRINRVQWSGQYKDRLCIYFDDLRTGNHPYAVEDFKPYCTGPMADLLLQLDSL